MGKKLYSISTIYTIKLITIPGLNLCLALVKIIYTPSLYFLWQSILIQIRIGGPSCQTKATLSLKITRLPPLKMLPTRSIPRVSIHYFGSGSKANKLKSHTTRVTTASCQTINAASSIGIKQERGWMSIRQKAYLIPVVSNAEAVHRFANA